MSEGWHTYNFRLSIKLMRKLNTHSFFERFIGIALTQFRKRNNNLFKSHYTIEYGKGLGENYINANIKIEKNNGEILTFVLQTEYHYQNGGGYYARFTHLRPPSYDVHTPNARENTGIFDSLITIFKEGFEYIQKKINAEEGDLAVGVMRSKFPDRDFDRVNNTLRRFLD